MPLNHGHVNLKQPLMVGPMVGPLQLFWCSWAVFAQIHGHLTWAALEPARFKLPWEFISLGY